MKININNKANVMDTYRTELAYLLSKGKEEYWKIINSKIDTLIDTVENANGIDVFYYFCDFVTDIYLNNEDTKKYDNYNYKCIENFVAENYEQLIKDFIDTYCIYDIQEKWENSIENLIETLHFNSRMDRAFIDLTVRTALKDVMPVKKEKEL